MIQKKDVLAVIVDYSGRDTIVTKSGILDELNLEDDKENRKLLTSIIKEMKTQGLIQTTYGMYDDTCLLGGRGYVC